MAPISSLESKSLGAIYDAFKRINERVDRISQFAVTSDDEGLVSDFVGLKQDLYTVQANGKVLKVDQELTQSILDILA